MNIIKDNCRVDVNNCELKDIPSYSKPLTSDSLQDEYNELSAHYDLLKSYLIEDRQKLTLVNKELREVKEERNFYVSELDKANAECNFYALRVRGLIIELDKANAERNFYVSKVSNLSIELDKANAELVKIKNHKLIDIKSLFIGSLIMAIIIIIFSCI